MSDSALRISQIIVRVVAMLTLAGLGLSAASDKYYPSFSHAVVNSSFGAVVIFALMVFSVLLPAYVVFEVWYAKRTKSRVPALWIETSLAIACFLTFLGIVMYSFAHYAMF